MISFNFIIQKELENSADLCGRSDMPTSTSNSKSGQMTKRFEDLEVDEIIESFDISDSVSNNLESSSNDQANSSDSYKPRPSRQHTLMTNGKKPRLSKNLKRKSKNSKPGRSQVWPFFFISGILFVYYLLNI